MIDWITIGLQRSVYGWITLFKNSRTSVTDDEQSGRPPTSTTEENIERVRTMMLDNRRSTIDEVAQHLKIIHGSAHEIINN